MEDDPQAVEEAIKTSCCGVVFDASQHAFPDNVNLTKKAAELAALRGVMVVGQLANLDNAEVTEVAAGGRQKFYSKAGFGHPSRCVQPQPKWP